jgi:hypothetical protein
LVCCSGAFAAGRPEQSLALWGLRGVGKTVLLNRFAIEADEAGWGSGYMELRGRGPLRPVLAQVATEAAHSLARREGIRKRLRQSLSVISSFSVTAMPAGVTFKVEVDPTPGRGDSGQLDVDLQDVLVELGETAQEAGCGVVLFFDEMQFAERDDLQALLAAFHRIAQAKVSPYPSFTADTSTRILTLDTPRRCVRGRPDRPFCGGLRTHRTHRMI